VSDLQDVIGEFVVESYENLDQLDRDLVALEREPASQPTLSSIFRTIHNIKGTCGFFGFGKLECVTHVGENLLSKLRDGELPLDADRAAALLQLVDAIRAILANIESLGAEGEVDCAALIDKLVRLQGGNLEVALATSAKTAQALPESENPRRTTVILSGADSTAEHATAADTTIRVNVGLLDGLLERVHELLQNRNQMMRLGRAAHDAELLAAAERLDRIATELHSGVLQLRLMPIESVWSKLPRLVRDLAVQCGKKVRIEMEGKETELDKTIIEAIKDPLTHLVRNAVDHGIERPAERLAAGKPAEGCLRLVARRDGGYIRLEIGDDGSGLDLELIRRKALERGLIGLQQSLSLTDREAAQLVFAPGFSTARQVTSVSGRGVGLDVVKTNVERVGGAVEIHSQRGRGTTVRLKIPITLTLVPNLILSA